MVRNLSPVNRFLSRLLLIFLLTWLPVQFAWAAVSGYCAHETAGSGGAAHFGHHDHQHDHANDDAGEATQPGGSHDANGAHPDCASCHFGVAVPPAGGADTVSAQRDTVIESVAIPPLSPPSARPERPNWRPA